MSRRRHALDEERWNSSHFGEYDMLMQAGSAGELGRQRNMDSIGFWKKLTEHPAYDSFWSEQAMDKVLARQPLTVPTMLVASLWDQEDIYGAMARSSGVTAAGESAATCSWCWGPGFMARRSMTPALWVRSVSRVNTGLLFPQGNSRPVPVAHPI